MGRSRSLWIASLTLSMLGHAAIYMVQRAFSRWQRKDLGDLGAQWEHGELTNRLT